MNEQEIDTMIRRLTSRFGAAEDASASPSELKHRADEAEGSTSSADDALRRLVRVDSTRFGASRIDRSDPSGISTGEAKYPLARMIDHTALKPETSVGDVWTLCDEARRFGFASVCVNGCYVPLAAEWLHDSDVEVCAVTGFPLGGNRTDVKVREAELAISDGATEIDMVLNVGMLRSEQYEYVESDIRAVVTAFRRIREEGVIKIIIETALLTDEQKVIACVLAQNAGADFVKTSTGFSTGGATASDVALMRRVVGGKMGVKASGGIRTRDDAETMIAHGATRIGASASVAIIQGSQGVSSY